MHWRCPVLVQYYDYTEIIPLRELTIGRLHCIGIVALKNSFNQKSIRKLMTAGFDDNV